MWEGYSHCQQPTESSPCFFLALASYPASLSLDFGIFNRRIIVCMLEGLLGGLKRIKCADNLIQHLVYERSLLVVPVLPWLDVTLHWVLSRMVPQAPNLS